MPRANPVRNPQIDERICLRIDRARARFGRISFNAMAELFLEQMCDLVETPASNRTVPPIALALDAVAGQRPRLNSTAELSPEAVADLAAMEAVHHTQPKKR